MIRRSSIIVALMVAAVVFADGPAGAEENGESRHRVGLWAVSAFAEGKSAAYDFWSFSPYWGYFLNEPGPGYKHSFEFCVEGFLNRHVSGFSDRFEVGVRPILRWHYGFEELISPFVEVSTAGVLFTNLEVPETGTNINFTSHAGAGVDLNLSPQFHMSLAYRFRHISNAGMSPHNGGVNHQQAFLGMSYRF